LPMTKTSTASAAKQKRDFIEWSFQNNVQNLGPQSTV
jgi:hypothetical protein